LVATANPRTQLENEIRSRANRSRKWDSQTGFGTKVTDCDRRRIKLVPPDSGDNFALLPKQGRGNLLAWHE
jgi:hypothetical protein